MRIVTYMETAKYVPKTKDVLYKKGYTAGNGKSTEFDRTKDVKTKVLSLREHGMLERY